MTGAGDVETELDRDIGIVGAIALGVGTMIAAGIFVLSGLAVSNVGAMAIVSFVIAAVVASFTAFAYAEFAAIYPESGGGYAYVANTFDSNVTYIVGWSMILGYPASAAFYLASFSDWFHRFIAPQLDLAAATPFWASGVVILGLLVGLNLKGTEESGQFQIVVTALKVALIVVFLVGGLQSFDAGTISQSFFDHVDDLRQVGLTTALVFITFFGFEAIATNAEEIESPGKNIPRAIFISMGLVTVIYALVVLVIVIAVNDPRFLEFLRVEAALEGLPPERFIQQNGEIAMGRAAQYYLGPVGFYVIIVGALFSMLSAANATILAGSRVKLAMSRRNHLPGRFGDLHDRFNTPYAAVLLTGLLIAFFILFFTVVFSAGPDSASVMHLPLSLPVIGREIHMGVEAIAHFADFMLLTGLVVVNLAVIRSRQKFPDIDRAFEVPGVPVVPAVAILANLVLLVNVEPGAFLFGLLAEVIGVGLWYTTIAPSAAETVEREAPAVVAERVPEETGYEILVPVANPDHLDQLLRTARDLAADEGGQVHVLSVVQVPEQTPLSQGDEYASAQREILDRAREITAGGGDADVPVSGTVRIAHHVDEAILHTIDGTDPDAVLLGWRGGEHPRRDRVLGTIADDVVAGATCDVLVERVGPGDDTIDDVLVPTAGGPHAEFAAETAAAIARVNGARIRAIDVIDPDAGRLATTDAREALAFAETVFGEDVAFETEIVESRDVADAIVAASADADLTVVGATRSGLIEQILFGSVPEDVGRRAEGTVIMAKRYLGIRSRLSRALNRLR